MVSSQFHYTKRNRFMPFLLAEILNFQGSTHRIGVGSFSTVIGENGSVISGGQRQRIALARALYKEFEILIMDEATAALDMETEKAVIDSIRQVKGNKTLLMVTHHMSLANECDLLYKIEQQKIIRVR